MAERAAYNKSGEVLSRFKLGDAESIDLSNATPIVDKTIVWFAARMMCDEQLRAPLISKQQLDNMKSFLFLGPIPGAQMFHGQVHDISTSPYQKELLAILKYYKTQSFGEAFPQAPSSILGAPSSYAGLAERVQVNCTDKKLLIPKLEYFDPQNYLIQVTLSIPAEPIVPNPGSGFAALVDVACRTSGSLVRGTYEGTSTAKYDKGGQLEQKILITIEQSASDLNVVYKTADGAEGKGSGKLTGNRVESISLESTTPGCPGSYKGSMEFPGDAVTWTFKGEDCGGAMEGHGTAKKTKS